MSEKPKMDTTSDTRPWFRQPWPWLLMVMPVTSLILGVVMVYLAITTDDGLVVDDYYRQGRVIDQTIARSKHAAELGLVAEMRVGAEDVRIDLGARDGVPLPQELVLTIAHPTRAGFDQVIRLDGEGGRYAGRVAPLAIGRWLIQIEDSERAWRLRGEVTLPDETRVTILPWGV